MITLTLQIPEPVAAEYYAAAEQLNGRFPGASPKIEAKALMSFALARHDCDDLCGQFDLALRLIQGPPDPPFGGAVLDPHFGRDSRPVPTQPARTEAAA
ncbi:MAG: hypothetical protein JWM32_3140 [Verrucomicrobia bacterium]|nr:hypothetical protein [Verrucomicrobiota bacterium]